MSKSPLLNLHFFTKICSQLLAIVNNSPVDVFICYFLLSLIVVKYWRHIVASLIHMYITPTTNIFLLVCYYRFIKLLSELSTTGDW
jgi:hypothetical protein